MVKISSVLATLRRLTRIWWRSLRNKKRAFRILAIALRIAKDLARLGKDSSIELADMVGFIGNSLASIAWRLSRF